jgi:transposase
MEWTITMNAKEIERKRQIEQILDKRISQREAGEILGISGRQMRRLLRGYREKGVEGLVSKHRGRSSNHHISEDKIEEVQKFIHDPVTEGFGPSFMAEKLAEQKEIKISKESMRQIMIAAGLHHPKPRKPGVVHFARERRISRGELVQIDGSEHAWLEKRGPKASLLLFIDDATSEILAARFVAEESYFSYGNLCQSYFREIGLPRTFYSDRFSVFRDNHHKDLAVEAVTQFQRALNTLEVGLICANSPQAKGRVERANETCQDRLVKELRLRGICTYQEANRYLPEFIQSYNAKFAVVPSSHLDLHRPLDLTWNLAFIFSVHDTRIITKTLQIHFDRNVYQIVTRHPAYFYAKQEVLITCDQAGQVSAWLDGRKLVLQPIKTNPKQGMLVSSKSNNSKAHPPVYNHPWKTYGKKLNGNPIPMTQ